MPDRENSPSEPESSVDRGGNLLLSISALLKEIANDPSDLSLTVALSKSLKEARNFVLKEGKNLNQSQNDGLVDFIIGCNTIEAESYTHHLNTYLNIPKWTDLDKVNVNNILLYLNKILIPFLQKEDRDDLVNGLQACVLAVELKVKSE